MAFGSGSKSYRPGERVPKAGIYKVVHQGHRKSHEVSLSAKEIFPACHQCGERVRFKAIAPHKGKKDSKSVNPSS